MEIEHDDLMASTQTVQFILAKYLNITCLLTDLLIYKNLRENRRNLRRKNKQSNKQTNKQSYICKVSDTNLLPRCRRPETSFDILVT